MSADRLFDLPPAVCCVVCDPAATGLQCHHSTPVEPCRVDGSNGRCQWPIQTADGCGHLCNKAGAA